MGKPDGLSRLSEEGKSGMDTDFFDEGQLLHQENDDVGEEEHVEDLELELLRESYILVYNFVVMELIVVEYIIVGRTGVNAYWIRIKLY